jgi:hypothetical protein
MKSMLKQLKDPKVSSVLIGKKHPELQGLIQELKNTLDELDKEIKPILEFLRGK